MTRLALGDCGYLSRLDRFDFERELDLSSARFQVSPQSLRLMVVVALKPACTLPLGSFA